MSSIEELESIAVIVCMLESESKRKRKRRVWSKSWLERRKFNHTNLLQELSIHPKDWNNYLRMDETTYFDLLRMVTPYIAKQDTVMRKAITPHEKLTTTIRYLCTGRTLEDMKFSTRISPQTLGRIIPETCDAISKALKSYCKCPTSEEEWKKVAKGYRENWNFPNCLGAMDGKHVAILPPPGSGSYFYNYKGFHSMVLFAIASANYEILYYHFGCNGRVSDGGVFEMTDFHRNLENGKLMIPREGTVSGVKLPFVFIADDAFPLRDCIMKPFSSQTMQKERKIFNYRLSRARWMIESVFGILAERFGVFQKPIGFVDVEKTKSVVIACCYLHNFLRSKIPDQYSPSEWLDSEDLVTGDFAAGPRMNSQANLHRGNYRQSSERAKLIREKIMQYFNSDGKVEWQDRFIN